MESSHNMTKNSKNQFHNIVTKYKSNPNFWKMSEDGKRELLAIDPIEDEDIFSINSIDEFRDIEMEKRIAWNKMLMEKINTIRKNLQVGKNMPPAIRNRAKKAMNYWLSLLNREYIIEKEIRLDDGRMVTQYAFKDPEWNSAHNATKDAEAFKLFWKSIITKDLVDQEAINKLEDLNEQVKQRVQAAHNEEAVSNQQASQKKKEKRRKQRAKKKTKKRAEKLKKEGEEQIKKAREQLERHAKKERLKILEEEAIKAKREFRARKKERKAMLKKTAEEVLAKEKESNLNRKLLSQLTLEEKKAFGEYLAGEDKDWDDTGKLSPQETSMFFKKGGKRKMRKKKRTRRKKKTRRRRKKKTRRRRRK